MDAAELCPAFTPTGPFPAQCASFDQLGVRVPLLAVSPFAKPSYVSHTVTDHTSILALIETRPSLDPPSIRPWPSRGAAPIPAATSNNPLVSGSKRLARVL
ncbi:MAG TPA: alkaline phosphatase family protein [Micromonosporaceae bacterium]|nr:alkaline phosphatase family protein [Micromonosporaceae bacterium]